MSDRESRWPSGEIYPDPAITTLDPSFNKFRLFNAGVDKLYSGTRWGEGPVWFGDARALLWSDIPNDRILKWDETTGTSPCFASLPTTPTGTRATALAAS